MIYLKLYAAKVDKLTTNHTAIRLKNLTRTLKYVQKTTDLLNSISMIQGLSYQIRNITTTELNHICPEE